MSWKVGFFPRSVFWQTAVVLGVALFVAQTAGFALLVNERQRWTMFSATAPTITLFADVAARVEAQPRALQEAVAHRSGGTIARFQVLDENPVAMMRLPTDAEMLKRLERALAARGVTVKAISASSRGFSTSPATTGDMRPPFMMGRDDRGRPPPTPDRLDGRGHGWRGGMRDEAGMPLHARPPGPPFGRDVRAIALAAQLPDGQWLAMEFWAPKPEAAFWWRVLAAEAVMFAVLIVASLLIALRVSRVLENLGAAARRFGAGNDWAPAPLTGPTEVRAVSEAFNDMGTRIRDLLDEKNRMLGAIGHDLRTPLAAMRIRAEAVEPASERVELAQLIDDTARMLEDILDLARLGHSTEARRMIDLAALLDSVVEDFRVIGADVTCEGVEKAPLSCQPLLVKRLLRNLIENAVKYGAFARCTVLSTADSLTVQVDDDGPGVPEAELSKMLEPFQRLETSRSRETGGAGLGLAIATAIARSQNARLKLENRPTGGLRASVTWRRTEPR